MALITYPIMGLKLNHVSKRGYWWRLFDGTADALLNDEHCVVCSGKHQRLSIHSMYNTIETPGLQKPSSSHLGLYSLSRKTSYRQISRSLEGARLGVIMIVSFWNLWQASRQHCCRDGCQISKRLKKSKHESRGFETSRDLAVRRLTA